MAQEQRNMGIGNLGFKNLIFKRKFRYTLVLQDICSGISSGGKSQEIPEHYVKVASRPNLAIEETEINFLNAKTWIPGKASWETMTVTYIDVADQLAAPLYNWLASVYNFTDPIKLQQGANRNDYSATAILKLWDGCGNIIEKWEMKDVWPTAVNFGDLDYAASDECTIELTLRYSDVKYENLCPGFQINPCCTGCNTQSPTPNTPNNNNNGTGTGVV